jgi:hypothetical protein
VRVRESSVITKLRFAESQRVRNLTKTADYWVFKDNAIMWPRNSCAKVIMDS